MVVRVVVKIVKKRRKMMVTVMVVGDYGDCEDNDSNEVAYIRMSVIMKVRVITTW